MSDIKNLEEVLASIKISCDNVAYGFATVTDEALISAKGGLAIFREEEGTTIIDSVDNLKSQNIKYYGPFAKLTVDAHTSLEMVGLTAILSMKLAEVRISANVVAAYYHDHVFVQYDRREEAANLLNGLSNE